MNDVFDRLLRRPGVVDQRADVPRHWRRVPRINVLPKGVAGARRRNLLRGILVAVLVIEFVYLYVQLQGKSADEAMSESVRAQLIEVQRELAAEQAVTDDLQRKVDEAAKRVADASAGYEQISAGRTNWHAGASIILATGTEGVEFTSITAQPDRVIVLRGSASDLGSMARFQARLREVSGSLQLQNINFETTSTALRFTATLRVVP